MKKHKVPKIWLIIAIILIFTLLFCFLLFETDTLYNVDISGFDNISNELKRPISVEEVRREVEMAQGGDADGDGYRDPGDGSIMPGIGGGNNEPPEDVEIHTDQVTDALIKELKSLGYDNFAIAGIMGNIAHESGFNPGTSQGHKHDNQTLSGCTNPDNGGDGHGLVQWDKGRRVNLINHAKSIGREWFSLEANLSYFKLEINGSEKNNGSPSVMNGNKTVKEATFHFAKHFERCGGATSATLETASNINGWSERYSNALAWYKELTGNSSYTE